MSLRRSARRKVVEADASLSPQPVRRTTRRNSKAPAVLPDVIENTSELTTSPVKSVQKFSTLPVRLEKEVVVPLGNDHTPGASKLAAFFRRLWTSLLMFAIFCTAVHIGHIALLSIIVVVQFLMYREIVKLAYSHLLTLDEARHVPLFRTQNWYWFFVTIFFAYGKIARSVLGFEIPYHMFLSFSFLVAGFVGFVLSLQKGLYRVQFSMFAWVLLALSIVVLQSTMLIYNMFQGLFWFVLPVLLIISNDTWAYIWGQLVGKTQLIAISPKKTWEGFIGALVSTCITAVLVAKVMINFPILTCPQSVLTLVHPTCELNAVFVETPLNLPFTVPVLGWTYILYSPVQFHALMMGVFASVIAPFGGFFASGFKRAFKIKDFGDLIPGHGGLTDRMDCQLLMGLFVYVYYWSFISSSDVVCDCTSICADIIAKQTGAVDLEGVVALAKKLSNIDKAALAKIIVKGF